MNDTVIKNHFWRLRWRFDYSGRGTKYGSWNCSSPLQKDMAAFQPKEGLVSASIEGESTHTFEMRTFYECDGHEYVSCQGEAYGKIRNPLGITGAGNPMVFFSGLSFITRDKKVTVFIDGTMQQEFLRNKKADYKFFEHEAGGER